MQSSSSNDQSNHNTYMPNEEFDYDLNNPNDRDINFYVEEPNKHSESNTIMTDINNNNGSNNNGSNIYNNLLHSSLERNKPRNSRKRNKPRKYDTDCLRKRMKYFVLKYSLEFINKKIREKVKGRDNLIKNIENTQIKNTNLNFEKQFMYTSLGDIFSTAVSKKFKKSIKDPQNYNKNKITELKSKSEDLKLIFDIQFIDCLNSFIGKKQINELKGMKLFGEIWLKDNKDKENLNYYAQRYEEHVNRARPRNKKEEMYYD